MGNIHCFTKKQDKFNKINELFSRPLLVSRGIQCQNENAELAQSPGGINSNIPVLSKLKLLNDNKKIKDQYKQIRQDRIIHNKTTKDNKKDTTFSEDCSDLEDDVESLSTTFPSNENAFVCNNKKDLNKKNDLHKVQVESNLETNKYVFTAGTNILGSQEKELINDKQKDKILKSKKELYSKFQSEKQLGNGKEKNASKRRSFNALGAQKYDTNYNLSSNMLSADILPCKDENKIIKKEIKQSNSQNKNISQSVNNAPEKILKVTKLKNVDNEKINAELFEKNANLVLKHNKKAENKIDLSPNYKVNETKIFRTKPSVLNNIVNANKDNKPVSNAFPTASGDENKHVSQNITMQQKNASALLKTPKSENRVQKEIVTQNAKTELKKITKRRLDNKPVTPRSRPVRDTTQENMSSDKIKVQTDSQKPNSLSYPSNVPTINTSISVMSSRSTTTSASLTNQSETPKPNGNSTGQIPILTSRPTSLRKSSSLKSCSGVPSTCISPSSKQLLEEQVSDFNTTGSPPRRSLSPSKIEFQTPSLLWRRSVTPNKVNQFMPQVGNSPYQHRFPKPANQTSTPIRRISEYCSGSQPINVSHTPTNSRLPDFSGALLHSNQSNCNSRGDVYRTQGAKNESLLSLNRGGSFRFIAGGACSEPYVQTFVIPERFDTDTILNDPTDRRIIITCERFHCEILELMPKCPGRGYLKANSIVLSGPNKECLRRCLLAIDRTMNWNLSQQLK